MSVIWLAAVSAKANVTRPFPEAANAPNPTAAAAANAIPIL
jgi:hypothetical protein